MADIDDGLIANGVNGSSYEDHTARENSRYVKAFGDFWTNLPPKQREFLLDNGIDGPITEYSSIASLDHDAADLPAASYREDMAERLDTFSDHLMEHFGMSSLLAIPLAKFMLKAIEQESVSYKSWLFGKVCGVMLNAGNAKLAAAGLAFAANLASLNRLGSMREYSRRIGVSVEAVSKVKRQWQDELRLPDSPHSKKPAACANYAIAARTKHWRTRKFTKEAMQGVHARTRALNGSKKIVALPLQPIPQPI